MRKRERENPCGVCGHYHKYEEGEVCGVCGHRMSAVSEKTSLKTQGISCVLNTVPSCQNLYKISFTYFCLKDDKSLPFDDAMQFLEQCERERPRVLVHCMSGKSRSPAIVIAYLMKSKGWRLAESYQWVKERRPSVELTQAVYPPLPEYEQKIFGSTENSSSPAWSVFQSSGVPSFSFGFPKPNDSVPVPTLNSLAASPIFTRPNLDIPPQKFTFGAGQTQNNPSGVPFGDNLQNLNSNDIPMDGS